MVRANLIARLVKDGHRVRMLIRSPRHPLIGDLPVEEIRGDLAAENMTHQEILSRMSEVLIGRPVRRTSPRILEYPLACAAFVASALSPSSSFTPHVVWITFRYRYFSAKRVQSELAWVPKVPFEKAVQQAMDFYQTMGLIQRL